MSYVGSDKESWEQTLEHRQNELPKGWKSESHQNVSYELDQGIGTDQRICDKSAS